MGAHHLRRHPSVPTTMADTTALRITPAGISDIDPRRIFDVRTVPCAHKHARIFLRWSSLAVGDWFVLVNDHRPDPLRAQFARLVPDCFAWTDLGEAENTAAVRIERLQPDPPGFNPLAVNGCGVPAQPHAHDDIAGRIEIDVREDKLGVAVARVVRLAGSMPPWMELVAVLAQPSPLLRRQLDLIGMQAREEIVDATACRYHVRPSP